MAGWPTLDRCSAWHPVARAGDRYVLALAPNLAIAG